MVYTNLDVSQKVTNIKFNFKRNLVHMKNLVIIHDIQLNPKKYDYFFEEAKEVIKLHH